MTRPEAKGWCPGAHRPMPSGDGLIVRVRPYRGRLNRAQVLALSRAAQRFGNGTIDLTSRGNLQLRGITKTSYNGLILALGHAALLDPDPTLEARRNILVAPDWALTDETVTLADALGQRLNELPQLPTKFGFAIDTGHAPILTAASADIRLERNRQGQLLVRADGAKHGRPVRPETAVEAILELANWFADMTPEPQVRMAQLLKTTTLPADWQHSLPTAPRAILQPGAHSLGYALGARFGQIEAAMLEQLVAIGDATGLRLTPWRIFIVETTSKEPWPGFICRPGAAELNVSACPGAGRCSAATVNTRELAQQLSARTSAPVHVSGCRKGCARPSAADITVIGEAGRYNLVHHGCAWDLPDKSDLSQTAILKLIDETAHDL